MAKRVIDQVSPKTSDEALDFVRKMQKAFPKKPRAGKERAALRKFLAKFTDAERRAVGRRLLSDLMQRPPRTITEGDYPPAPVAGPTKQGTKPKAGRAGKRPSAKPPRRRARRS
jgi:hypothetical protein